MTAAAGSLLRAVDGASVMDMEPEPVGLSSLEAALTVTAKSDAPTAAICNSGPEAPPWAERARLVSRIAALVAFDQASRRPTRSDIHGAGSQPQLSIVDPLSSPSRRRLPSSDAVVIGIRERGGRPDQRQPTASVATLEPSDTCVPGHAPFRDDAEPGTALADKGSGVLGVAPVESAAAHWLGPENEDGWSEETGESGSSEQPRVIEDESEQVPLVAGSRETVDPIADLERSITAASESIERLLDEVSRRSGGNELALLAGPQLTADRGQDSSDLAIPPLPGELAAYVATVQAGGGQAAIDRVPSALMLPDPGGIAGFDKPDARETAVAIRQPEAVPAQPVLLLASTASTAETGLVRWTQPGMSGRWSAETQRSFAAGLAAACLFGLALYGFNAGLLASVL